MEPDETSDEKLDKVRRHIRILIDLGRIAGEKPDIDRFLDLAVIQVARAVEIDHVKVLKYRHDTADFIVAAGVGWKPGAVRSATLSADMRSAPGRSYHTAEPVVIHDFAKQDEFVLSNFLKEHGIVSLSNVPILVDGASWGVLEVDSTTPRDFSQDTTEFLTAAGATIGRFVQSTKEDPHLYAKSIAAALTSQDRDVMLREMQHRVKNNFQLILGSIASQRRRHSSPDTHRALDYVATRINAISIAHDQLAPRQDSHVVKFADYLRALCQSIKQQTDNIEIEVEADEMELAIDRAVPLGLFLNEVATNSIKHAFGPEGGRISVRLLSSVGYGESRLTVSDNGKGFLSATAKGSGLKLIESLARGVGGTVSQESSGSGTTTSLQFPMLK